MLVLRTYVDVDVGSPFDEMSYAHVTRDHMVCWVAQKPKR